MNSLTQFWFVCAAFFGISWSLEDKCPPEDQMTPCTCKTYLDGACIITCALAEQKHIDRIADISNPCGGNVHFVLVHSKVDGIPAKLWRTLLQSSTVDVAIKYSSMQGLVPPESSDTIGKVSTHEDAIIKVGHTDVGYWNWNQFRNFVSDGELTIVVDDSPLNELGSEFKNIAEGRVHKIIIESAGLNKVQDNEFVSFEDLTSLSLQNNDLTSISRSMIARPAKKLQFLHLNGNKLDNLPVDLFTDMPALEVVYLRENNLKSVPTDLLRHIVSTRLQRIDFVNNPWICDCNLLSFLSSTHIFMSMGTCASPEVLAQKKIGDLHKLITC